MSGYPLSNEQKKQVCILARDAWDKAGRPGDFNQWRHDQQVRACGHASLRSCGQGEFNALRAHFLNLLGRSDEALNVLLRDATNNKRIALYKLREACRERGLAMSYPKSICQRQFRVSLEEASERQLWCLVYTVRSRRKPFSQKAA